jgi:hypothetical protein
MNQIVVILLKLILNNHKLCLKQINHEAAAIEDRFLQLSRNERFWLNLSFIQSF